MANDIVRTVTIRATGENIDRTTGSVTQLDDATKRASASNDNFAKSSGNTSSSMVNMAAGVYLARTAVDGITAASDGASSALGRMTQALVAVVMYLPNKVGEVWQEGVDKLKTYIDLNEKAGSLSVEFYQRLVKGATDAKKPAEEYLGILKNINKALDRELGDDGLQNGSKFNTAFVELQKNGNLEGVGASRLNNSVTGPEKLNNSIELIQKALDAGQTLVALKLTNTLFGSEATENLRKDNDYFFKIQKSIADVQAKDIISQADVDRAAGLQAKLDAAYKILADRDQKARSDWSGWGIEIQSVWVGIVSQYAQALQWLDKILGRTDDIANASKNIKPSNYWQYFNRAATAGEGQDQTEEYKFAPGELELIKAKQQLAGSIQNPKNVQRSYEETQRAADALRPDTSKPKPKDDDDKEGAWDRATGAVEKYIQQTQEAAKNIDAAAGEQEKFKVIAQLTAAGIKDGMTPALARAKAEASDLATRAGDVADALARAKVSSQLEFDRKTAFLSQEDVQIATALKGLYGKDVPAALASTEAAGMRTNAALKELGGIAHTAFDSMTPAIRDAINGTTSLGQSFKNLGLVAVKALEDMIIKLTIIKPLESALMGSSGLGGVFSALGIGGGSGSTPLWTVPGDLGAGTGGLSFPKFAAGTDYAPGGPSLVGEDGPEIVNLPRGASVTPNKQSMQALSGGGVQVSFAPTYHVTGSGPEIADLKAQMARDRAEFEARTIAAVRKAQKARSL